MGQDAEMLRRVRSGGGGGGGWWVGGLVGGGGRVSAYPDWTAQVEKTP